MQTHFTAAKVFMEQIKSHLVNLGYTGSISEDDFNNGPAKKGFIEIVTWLSSQLVTLFGLESHVSENPDPEDCIEFAIELSSFLKELCCPYKSLTTGEISGRLMNTEDKKLLITYLITELEAAKIDAVKNPKKKESSMKILLEESKTAKELREMLIFLRFPKPPETITPQMLFGEVEKKLYMISQPSAPKEKVGDLLFSGCLTEKQWFQLEYLYKEMHEEYKTRRNLLLTRLDVTVRSFLWADRLKSKTEDITNMYNKRKCGITVEPSVKISDILAAKLDLAVIEKTSSATVRKNTTSSVNKVVIGAVPDRGGRPEEQQPPPPEVPSWQKSDSSNRGGRQPIHQSSGNYKSTGYSRDENSNPRSPIENNYKGDNPSRGNYRGGRNDYNTVAPPPPVYQQVPYYAAQIGNAQLGFGGYLPAGDNFQQYGMVDSNAMNHYQARGSRRSGHRGGQRGGYSDRGSSQSHGRSRGGGGGRGHY